MSTIPPATYTLPRQGQHTDYLFPAQLRAQRYQPFSPDKTDKLIAKQSPIKVLLMDDNALMGTAIIKGG